VAQGEGPEFKPQYCKKKKEFKTSLELYTEMLSQENKDAKKKSQINSRRL
jgi:hypothetical protein